MSNNLKRKNKNKILLKNRNIKKLKKRTENKIKKINRRKNKTQSELLLKKNKNYNKETNDLTYIAPNKFSIIDNSDITIKYFNDIIKFLKNDSYKKINVFFELNNVEYITIDAIMYMLALIKNTKIKHNSRGSIPQNDKIAKIFYESGFLNYINSHKKIPVPKVKDKIQIKMSNNSDDIRIVGVKILQFITEKFNITLKKINFLYRILYELMLNTTEHAYNTSNLLSYWYLFLEIDNDIIKISLLDTGTGIPNTISKRIYERGNVFNLFPDGELIISALYGKKLRTETKEKHRGKGLPSVTEKVKMGLLENFVVISGKAKVYYCTEEKKYKYFELKNDFVGTLYYFEIDTKKMKEKVIK